LEGEAVAAAMAACPFPVRLLRESPGVCRQRNRGARESAGDLLFFFDDDVVPEPDFIEILAEVFVRNPEYRAGMGTLAPAMRRWSPGALLCRLFLLQREHGDGRYYPSGMPRHPYGTGEFREVEVLGAGLMAVRRAVFAEDKVEFDERLPLMWEDVDFSRRLSRRGRLFFEPRARVEHSRSPAGRPDDFERGRRYMLGYRRLYLQHFYPRAPWTLPAHWWALLGMFVVAAATGSRDALRGYADGFGEFSGMGLLKK
jgi:GT2 family glycosyltransferase